MRLSTLARKTEEGYTAGTSTSSFRGTQRALILDQRQVAIEPPLEVTFFRTPKSLSDEATGVFVDAINEFATARMKDFFQNKFPEHTLDTVEFQVLQKQSIQHKDDANIYGTTFILGGAFTFETTNIPSAKRCNNKLMTIMQNYWKLETAIRNRNHSELSPYPSGEAFSIKASEWELDSSLCVDTPGWEDIDGFGCDWYLEHKDWACEKYYDFGANIHCCVCQGFVVSSTPSVSSAPSRPYKPSSARPSVLQAPTPQEKEGFVWETPKVAPSSVSPAPKVSRYSVSPAPSRPYNPSSAPSVLQAPTPQVDEMYWEGPLLEAEPEETTLPPNPRNPDVPAEQTMTSVKIIFPPKQSIMIWSILQIISSCLSLIATITIIIMIARSYAKLSSTFHRLLLGLCIADILSSIGHMLSTTPVPSIYSEEIWNASGNTATCTVQGFILFLGLMTSQLYNCSLCIYYLIIIKYNKKDDYIRKFVEPWLHAVPILISLIGGITILAKKAFNAGYTNCSIGGDPPGCTSSDLLECKRGGDAKTLFLVFAAIPYITVPCVIASTMGIMYYTARQNEKKMKGYGIHTLRLNTASTTVSSNRNDETESSNEKISCFQKLRTFFRLSSSASSASPQTNRSRKLNKQSKAVLQKALAYSLAYLATFICPFIISIINLAGGEASFGLSLISRILFPLQGLFNFFVFIFPRIQSAKRGNANLSWSRAFVYALKSRGSRPKGVARRKN